jgi:hypothetical protein
MLFLPSPGADEQVVPIAIEQREQHCRRCSKLQHRFDASGFAA